MTMKWKGLLSEDHMTFSIPHGRTKEVVQWMEPGVVGGEFRPGVLVTYTPGGKYWAGRGQQAYMPAYYTTHIVMEAEVGAGGKTLVTYVRAADTPCALKNAREQHQTDERRRQARQKGSA